ncbi:MAG: response regulator transcription factor [Gemmatimonadota bacterium]|nr:MAG: response regulator transcription factor [Gemmatimonadota bacterium]
MRILIIEDEKPIADYIVRLCRSILGDKIQSIRTLHTLEQAKAYLIESQIDLCLLDLNLNGENGFELLKSAVSGPFHTIIISAHTEQAIEAFHHGVLDFIPKPFDEERLRIAFERYFDRRKNRDIATRYFSARIGNQHKIILIDDIDYFKSAGNYVEAHLKNGKTELLNKTMDRLGQILPPRFKRIHRSCFVDLSQVYSYRHAGGGKYKIITRSGDSLPLSRQTYKELHDLLNV